MKLVIAFMITLFMSVNGKPANVFNSFSSLETKSQGREEIESHPIRVIRAVLPVFFCWYEIFNESIGTTPSDSDWNQKFVFTSFRPIIVKVIACLESINHSSSYKKKLDDIMQHLNFLASLINFT